MVICRKPLILAIDLAGVASVAALLAAVGVWVLLPLQRDLTTLPALKEDALAVHRQCAKLAAQNAAMAQSLDAHEQALRAQAAQPLADVPTLLASVSELCAQSGVTLQQVQPLASGSGELYRSWQLQVRAVGPFPSFHELLCRIERLSPYVQVSNMLVVGPSDRASQVCELAFTVQVNYLQNSALEGQQ